MINDQKVDVGTATIQKPKERLFQGQLIPVGTFRVSLASVKAGHEDLAPPVWLGGEDDETPDLAWTMQGLDAVVAGESSSWEATESTPMTTPQQGMNTTPPTQLPAPLVLGESGGRRSEEGQIVDNAVAPWNKEWMMTWSRSTLSVSSIPVHMTADK